jgi:hypothetical protein
MDKQLFALGRIVATPGALEAMSAGETNGFEYLARHAQGDWGDLCQEDKRENDLSVREGFRILSAYRLRTGAKLWLITEADRSVTTFLLPAEY